MNNGDLPLVSVLMTSYNRQDYIAEAIESVLASSLTGFELIIVDDRSSDNTLTIARRYEQQDQRVRVFLNQKNLGDYPNRNKAAEYAKGKYIKYLDSDDIIYPPGLETMVRAMEMFPDAGIGFSNFRYDGVVCLPYMLTSAEAYREHYLKGGFLFTGPTGAIYRRNFFNSVGKFNTKYDVATDYEFNLKAAFNSSVVIFSRDLFWWRPHAGQEINLKKDLYESLNFEINSFYLRHNNCPIPLPERIAALNNYRNLLSRKILRTAINFNFKRGIIKYQKYNLTISNLLLSLLPSSMRRKFQKVNQF